jgi:hypothetical protein
LAGSKSENFEDLAKTCTTMHPFISVIQFQDPRRKAGEDVKSEQDAHHSVYTSSTSSFPASLPATAVYPREVSDDAAQRWTDKSQITVRIWEDFEI